MEQTRVDTMPETDRKCGGCGGTMTFDPAGGDLLCAYCKNRRTIPQADETGAVRAAEQSFASAEATGNCDWGKSQKAVRCKSCGAETVYDALTVSDVCAYCGSAQVLDAGAPSALKPGGVCPFTVTREAAGKAFSAWLAKRWFCPRAAKRSARPETLKGLYLPCWTFDADTRSRYTAQFGIDRSERSKDGKERTVTDWYPTSGTFSESFDDRCAWGTKRVDPALLAGILPFRSGESRAYRPEYLSGFAAERYSVGLADAWALTKREITDRIAADIRSRILFERGAHRVQNLAVTTEYGDVAYKYLLFPAWVSTFLYKGKRYQFLVNGETGKVAGRTPVSVWRVLIAVLIAAALIGLIVFWATAK